MAMERSASALRVLPHSNKGEHATPVSYPSAGLGAVPHSQGIKLPRASLSPADPGFRPRFPPPALTRSGRAQPECQQGSDSGPSCTDAMGTLIPPLPQSPCRTTALGPSPGWLGPVPAVTAGCSLAAPGRNWSALFVLCSICSVNKARTSVPERAAGRFPALCLHVIAAQRSPARHACRVGLIRSPLCSGRQQQP